MDGRFTDEELAIAKSVDLCAVAESLGYTVKRIGKYHTLKEMDSIRIYNRSHWYRWSRQFDKGNNGGSQIDFLRVFCGMSVKEAVFWLLDFAGYRRIENPVKQPLVHQVSQKQAEERKPFVLPEPAGDNSYLISYLNQERGISRTVIDLFLKDGLIYESRHYHNVVFKGNDKNGVTRFASMRGDGTNINGEIGELHLSAISEAMNQMMGSSATSLSSMLNRTIDISPPIAEVVDLKNTLNEGEIDSFLSEEFVKISFRMEIGDLVDSEIMQLYPPAFVKEMCKGVSQNMELDTQSVTEDVPQSSNTATQAAPIQQAQDAGSMNNASANSQGMINENMMNSNMNSQNMMNQGMMNQNMGAQNMIGNQVNVQNAQFTPFGAMPNQAYQPENIDLIMDVPLEVTVELGRTKKSISEILDFGPGKIIELNKLAGEPIDILVNGKYVAKGEVVVIEESFGVRITEIVNSKINTGKTK